MATSIQFLLTRTSVAEPDVYNPTGFLLRTNASFAMDGTLPFGDSNVFVYRRVTLEDPDTSRYDGTPASTPSPSPTTTDVFAGVASVQDMQTYGTDPDEAGIEFWRSSEVELYIRNSDIMDWVWDNIKADLESLRLQMEAYETLTGPDSETFQDTTVFFKNNSSSSAGPEGFQLSRTPAIPYPSSGSSQWRMTITNVGLGGWESAIFKHLRKYKNMLDDSFVVRPMGVASPTDLEEYPAAGPDDLHFPRLFRKNTLDLVTKDLERLSEVWDLAIKEVRLLFQALRTIDTTADAETVTLGTLPLGSSSSSSFLSAFGVNPSGSSSSSSSSSSLNAGAAPSSSSSSLNAGAAPSSSSSSDAGATPIVDLAVWIDGPGVQSSGSTHNFAGAPLNPDRVRLRNATQPIVVDGDLEKLRLTYTPSGGTASAHKISVWRGGTTAAPTTMVWETIGITPIKISNMLWEFDLSDDTNTTEHPVLAGDTVAFEAILPDSADRLYMSSGSDTVWYDDGTGVGGQTWTEYTAANRALQWEAEISSPSYLVDVISSPASGQSYRIPTLRDEPYYVVFEDAIVNAGTGDLDVFMQQRDPADRDSGLVDQNGFQMDFSAYTCIAKLSAGDETITETSVIGGKKHQLAMWVDVQNQDWNLLWCCNGYGTGGKSGGSDFIDITWRSHAAASLQARRSKYTADTAMFYDWSGVVEYRPYRYVRFAGSGYTVAKMSIVRKPVVVLGDSYGANPVTFGGIVRGGVASDGNLHEPGSQWLQERYTLVASINGNDVIGNQVPVHVVSARYGLQGVQDSTASTNSSNSVIGRHDICEFVNAILVMPNGPNTNQVGTSISDAYGSITAAEGDAIIDELLAKIAFILGDWLGDVYTSASTIVQDTQNSGILCEMLYRPESTQAKADFVNARIDHLNAGLRLLSQLLNVPIAQINSAMSSKTVTGGGLFGGLLDPSAPGDVHPSVAGYTQLALLIAQAHDYNLVASQ
jgi:hypothetical protein